MYEDWKRSAYRDTEFCIAMRCRAAPIRAAIVEKSSCLLTWGGMAPVELAIC
jgi:hypothetical protein